METKYLLVNSLHDRLFLDLFDYNDHRSHTKLSTAIFELSALEDDATRDNLVTTLLKDGKERGELRYGVNFYPIIEPEEGAADLPDSSEWYICVSLGKSGRLCSVTRGRRRACRHSPGQGSGQQQVNVWRA